LLCWAKVRKFGGSISDAVFEEFCAELCAVNKYFPFLMLALTLTACAKIEANPSSIPTLKEGRSVEVGKETEATVGSVVYSEYNYYAAQGAVTRAPFATTILFAKVIVPAGSQLINANVEGQTAYCTTKPAYFVPGEARSICLFYTRGSGVFDKFYIVNTLSSLQYDASIPYSKEETSSDSTGYKYELLYEGIAGDVIKLAYREYTNNFVRPAFQQDLSYTLRRPGPTEITFRGVRMEILAADNNRIRYRVVSGFSPG
jgi:hypothetical protein